MLCRHRPGFFKCFKYPYKPEKYKNSIYVCKKCGEKVKVAAQSWFARHAYLPFIPVIWVVNWFAPDIDWYFNREYHWLIMTMVLFIDSIVFFLSYLLRYAIIKFEKVESSDIFEN
ncbi:MAG: hypothetical protein E7385_02980 [Ruminococcaceae bacterium]|nr:hypothetical protein [Oscillospiraceae bacterium]